jgi:hypothetical protein
MTDPTTQPTAGPVIAPPPAAIVPPTFESVSAKAHDLLLEIDNSQVHTEVSQFLIAGRAQVVAALSFVEAHYTFFEQKIAAAAKAEVATTAAPAAATAAAAAPAAADAPATQSASTATTADPAAPAAPAAAPAATAAQ